MSILKYIREIRKKDIAQRQRAALKLQNEIKDWYDKNYPLEHQKSLINEMRVEFQERQRELGEEYMRKELSILKGEKVPFKTIKIVREQDAL